MRPYRLRLAIAVWLGVIALGFNALVPIHLAFDLAHSLAPEDHDHGSEHGFVACLLSLVVGHDEDEDQSPSHKGHPHENCAVCSSISTLAGLAPAAAVLLGVPILVYAARLGVVDLAAPRAAPLVAYRSRAPPIAWSPAS
jgi:hypothetical protein